MIHNQLQAKAGKFQMFVSRPSVNLFLSNFSNKFMKTLEKIRYNLAQSFFDGTIFFTAGRRKPMESVEKLYLITA